MVVVDPDEWKNVLVLLDQTVDGCHGFVGEELIHFNVSLYNTRELCQILSIRSQMKLGSNLPVFGEENGSVWHGVKQRPERAVAAAIVKLSKLIFLHEDGHNLVVLRKIKKRKLQGI